MKKVIALSFVLSSFFAVSSFAQRGPGGFGDPSKMKERESKTYQDSLGFSKEKADTVAGVKASAFASMRTTMQNTDRSQMREVMQKMQEETNTKIRALLTDDEYQKYEAFEKRSRERMRQGGGRRGEGRPSQD